VAGGNRPLTREQELRATIEKAQLPARDYRIYMALFARAEWVTAKILDRFQPRSLDELAAWSRMSRSNVAGGLNHLTRHGWLLRHRNITAKGIGGRGHGTKYELVVGKDCDCSKASRSKTVPADKPSRNREINRPETCDVSAGQGPVPAKSVRDEGEVEKRAPEVRVLAEPGQSTNGSVRTPPDWSRWPAGEIGEWENRP
jgi:hypothetical protein